MRIYLAIFINVVATILAASYLYIGLPVILNSGSLWKMGIGLGIAVFMVAVIIYRFWRKIND